MTVKKRIFNLLCLVNIFFFISIVIVSVYKVALNKSIINTLINNVYNDSVFKEVKEILNRRVKVFCIVLTSQKYHEERAIHQRNTWIKRCNNYIFGSGTTNDNLPSIKACHNDSYHYTMCKFRNTVEYVWKEYGENYDWYIVVNDNTYVIMENLKIFLLNKDSNDLNYYGNNFKSNYSYGGESYIMSKKVVKRLVEIGFDTFKYCSEIDDTYDDIKISDCLKNLGLKLRKTYDIMEKPLFNQFTPQDIAVNSTKFRKRYSSLQSYINIETGLEKLSDFPVAFHYVDKTMMYILEYLLYRVQVVGRGSIFDKMNERNMKINYSVVQENFILIDQFSKIFFTPLYV